MTPMSIYDIILGIELIIIKNFTFYPALSVHNKISQTHLFFGDMFQDNQWMPETTEYQTLYKLCFAYTYRPMVKVNL